MKKILFLFFPVALLTIASCVPPPRYITQGGTVFLQGNAGLQNGPMVGYADMREVLIWVQAKGRSNVLVEYWETETPDVKYKTDVVTTTEFTNTAKCIADMVQPGKSYQYTVYINGQAVKLAYPTTFKTQSLWQWRTDPPTFTLATGSCAYINEIEYDRPGKGYGSDYQIFTRIAEQKPDLMIWLGDNVYFREPDWNTRTGMKHRYTHDRATPEMQQLFANTSHYAIWDDHDFGPNDADGTWIHKDMAWDMFKDFWGNPTFGVNGQKGCTTQFKYNDVDFFLLDNRYNRTPNYCKTCPDRTLLGKEQLEWFLGALAASQAPFKMVAIGGQVLTTNNNSETCFHFFPAERDTILARIERENIKGVIFLTGDRHFSELSAMKNKAGNWIYDLTSSSMTAGVYAKGGEELNAYRVEGTVGVEHNFATLEFSGPRKAREVKINLINIDGKTLWTKTITQEGGIK